MNRQITLGHDLDIPYTSWARPDTGVYNGQLWGPWHHFVNGMGHR
jgi:hypothetical protein